MPGNRAQTNPKKKVELKEARALAAKAIKDIERSNARQKNGGKHPIKKTQKLLASKQFQEIAWMHCVMDPAAYAARMPITQVTGAIPVDLYRARAYQAGPALTNASGVAFASAWPDLWHFDSGNQALLHTDAAADTAAGTYTTTGYLASTFPPNGVCPAGAGSLILGDVSADFTDTASAGTEYIQVGVQLSLEMVLPSQANDKAFEGEVWAFTTLDPERYPINGANPTDLAIQAQEESSSYSCAIYGINPNGSFTFKRDSRGRTGGQDTLSVLKLVAVPVSTGAYKWQRIGAVATNPVSTTASGSCVGFFITSPAGTTYRTIYTSVYQTEKYPTALIRPHRPAYGNSPIGDLVSIASQAANSIAATQGHLNPAHVSGASVLDHYTQSQPGFGSKVWEGGKEVLSGIVNSGLLSTLWNAWKSNGSTMSSLPSSGWNGPTIEELPNGVSSSSATRPSWITEAEEVGEDVLPLIEMA